MNRVEVAIQAGRCVIALGSRALAESDIVVELRRRPNLITVGMEAKPAELVQQPSAENLSCILDYEGGVLVLVDPEVPGDAPGLTVLGRLVETGRFKPKLVIVAKAFNPFMLPSALRMLKMEQEKSRARDFVVSLPASALPAVAPAPAPVIASSPFAKLAPASVVAAPAAEDPNRKGKGDRAPRCAFVGREAELSQLQEMLSAGGPVVVHGPPGVGKRWLLERAIELSKLRRVPDIHLGWGTETDALYGRFAAWCQAAGDRRLSDVWNHPDRRPAPEQMAALVIECLQNPALAEGIMVIRGMENRMREDGTFHRNGRLEILLEALLTSEYAPRMVFATTLKPVFYREGVGVGLRALAVAGLKGKELYELFDAYRFSEVPRDLMGELHLQTHGHPFMTRLAAITGREAEDPARLLGDRKSFKMSDLTDLEVLQRHLRRRLDKLPAELKRALVLAAHFRYPVSVDALQAIGVDRGARLALLGHGLLDMDPQDGGRSMYVHSLVKELIPRRELQELETLERIGDWYGEAARKTDGLERIYLLQEANRYYMGARRPQRLLRVGHLDQDPIVESVRGLIRSERPFISMAEERLGRVLNADPGHTEAWILRAETAALANANPETITRIYEEGMQRAPTLEIFHHQASWHLSRGKRGDVAAAIETLRRGVTAFPMNGRIRRRLAGCLVDAGMVDESIQTLRETMDLEPMMPDTYGLLGGILIGKGPGAWAEASQHLDEALRLSPEDPIHLWRLGRLERLQGLIDRENRDAHFAKAEEAFEKAIRVRRRHGDAMREYAILLLDRPGKPDLDRVGWLLKQVEQLKDGPDVTVENARLLTRRDQAREAEELLGRIVKRDPKHYMARAALGEAAYARGQVFVAAAAYQRAQEDAPPNAPERIAFEVIIEQLRALIESGEAIAIQRRAEEEELARVQAAEPVPSDLNRRSLGRERKPRRPSGRARGEQAVSSGEASETEQEPDAVTAEADTGSETESATPEIEAQEDPSVPDPIEEPTPAE